MQILIEWMDSVDSVQTMLWPIWIWILRNGVDYDSSNNEICWIRKRLVIESLFKFHQWAVVNWIIDRESRFQVKGESFIQRDRKSSWCNLKRFNKILVSSNSIRILWSKSLRIEIVCAAPNTISIEYHIVFCCTPANFQVHGDERKTLKSFASGNTMKVFARQASKRMGFKNVKC